MIEEKITNILLWISNWPWLLPLILACILYPLMWWGNGYRLPNGEIWPKCFGLCPNCNGKEWLIGDPCPECIGAPKNKYKIRLGQK